MKSTTFDWKQIPAFVSKMETINAKLMAIHASDANDSCKNSQVAEIFD